MESFSTSMYQVDQVVAKIKVTLKARLGNAFCGNLLSYSSEQVLKGTIKRR